MTDEWTAVLPYIGSALFLVGTSGGIANGRGMGSLVRLIAGAPERDAQLTERSQALEHRLTEAVEPICGQQRVSFAVAEGCYVAAADWSDEVSEAFGWYLVCRTIGVARSLAIRDDPALVSLNPDQLRAVVESLHYSSRVPTNLIAQFLDVDVATVRAILPMNGHPA